jgi:hypothetical protein
MRMWWLVPALALSACVSTVLPVTDGRIATRSQFVATVGDMTLANSDTVIQVGRHWKFRGTTKGIPIEGKWDFRDGLWCRQVTKPEPTAVDCQIWSVRGDYVTVTRERGLGETLRFKILRPGYPA